MMANRNESSFLFMVRKIRVECPAEIYHIINRGDRGEDIFHEEKDREVFSEALERCVGSWRHSGDSSRVDGTLRADTGGSSTARLLYATPSGSIAFGGSPRAGLCYKMGFDRVFWQD
ncbi:MAG: hypothetical protein JWM16_2869 [Verrucomicrobiales bacterium]|nr:hypothetical protein [Verrucomicrobiales bacterium]